MNSKLAKWKVIATAVWLMIGIKGEAVTLAPESFAVSAAGRELMIPYQGSHPLAGEQGHVKRVVVAVHSATYRAQEAYNAVIVAKGSHAGAADEVSIVAPQFLESGELPAVVPDDLLYWNSFPFRGTSSARFGPSAQRVSISAFDVMDRLLGAVTDPAVFPNLETLVVVGHSAGGQLVNRYAIAGRFAVPEGRNLHVRFLVMAPSSYLYFTPERDADGDGVFEVPAAACPEYDDYGYGMQALYNYPAGTGLTTMIEQYPQRFVFYLVGALDNDPDDPSLATDCAAMAQGPQRVARASAYFGHLQAVFGPEILNRQSFAIVPGVGHSYSGQLSSALGRRYLLDIDSTDTDTDSQTDWAEWIAGTDAADSGDFFRTSWLAAGGGALELAWPAADGRRYRVWTAGSPGGPFSEAALLRPVAGMAELNWPVVPSAAPLFLRIGAELD